jgi:hypothetical protein
MLCHWGRFTVRHLEKNLVLCGKNPDGDANEFKELF